MILGRYVFREVLTSALLGTLLATFVIFLQGLSTLFATLIRASAPGETVFYLLALGLPPVLPLSVPFGVLVGILIGLGRMAADGEITAMRAAGVPGRKVLVPVLLFALLATGLTGASSLVWGPASIRETVRVVNSLLAEQLTAEIQPRVFEEQFANNNTILYVGDVRPGPVPVWQNVFIADLTPPEERRSGLREEAEGPLITVAQEAIAVAEPENHRVRLSMRNASTHEVGKDLTAYDTYYPVGDQTLSATPPAEQQARRFVAIDTPELLPLAGYTAGKQADDPVEARIELHRRLALPVACLMMALIGIPLGIATRRGGKSAGYVTAVFLAFFCYYLAFISLIGVAKQGRMPVELAVWLPNLAFGAAGVIFLARLERSGDRDLIATLKEWFDWLLPKKRVLALASLPSGNGFRIRLMPQLIDTYVLSQFLFYFFLLLASFVAMTEIYTFFDLLGDIVRNNIGMGKVFSYLFFLTPKLVYDTAPLSILVGVLVTFGVLTKHNEITAFKASGVSVYRLSAPVLLASTMVSGFLFAFDYTWVPQANRIQDALRDEIKGRPVQTYLRPDRKWIFGQGSRIYYYKYFDMTAGAMAGVSVFELEPETFRLRKQIYAERAEWRPSLNTWVFETGWWRIIADSNRKGAAPDARFENFQVATFPELSEPPSYFLKEVKQDKQMNFRELEQYIDDLQQSGFDTVRLRVQYHRKFAVPLFALIMAMLSAPFAFLVGNRGAMAGIGVSMGVAILYLAVGKLFEQFGNASYLPPEVAAWTPDAIFSLGGCYLLLRMRT
ncbi:MAG: LptF/LptG family permease [Bryobacterales bacterium]|nr:LptF/LptG family permease [Bryobacterales bacterium]